ncbi:MAG: HAMP domain-containing protein [Deltaproteobacteria bacterium]|nr:HAMP domain-containing protein [Deltaproteobacteria bacterium]
MKIPISIKLIIITSLLLIGVTVPVSIKTSSITKEKLVDAQQDNNIELAKGKSREIDHIFSGLKDKISLNGRLLLSLKETEEMLSTQASNANAMQNYNNLKRDIDNNFNLDSFILGIEAYKFENSMATKLNAKYKAKTEANMVYNEQAVKYFRKYYPIYYTKIVEGKGNMILLNSSIKGYEPVLTIGLPLIRDAANKITHVVIADISLSVLQKTVSENGTTSSFFITDANGITLADVDETKVINKVNISDQDIVSYAKESIMANGMKYIKDKKTRKAFYAAFSKTSFGPIVFAQLDENVILAVIDELNLNIIRIVGYFLSGTLFLIFLFSMSLTQPLEKLTSLIRLVSKGNFNVKAALQINSFLKDEVRELAVAFDQMTEGLKERDKVKNLFNKFHGSSITEDLMKKDVSIGGQSKEVIVFFSDIRGFTAFSEKKKPEEVVKMLNEYFAVMVKIINSHGGIVDKFIGDAIMAVWGVPKSSNKDAHNAVKACLEMRKALAELNDKRLARSESPIQIGMGLHYGSAISGTIGSEERMEYTIIGNTVNTGSRIESSTKAFGSDLLVSDTVIEKVGSDFLAEYAGSAEVKGRSEPLKLHKIRGFKKPDGEYEVIVTPYSDYEPEAADKVKIAA